MKNRLTRLILVLLTVGAVAVGVVAIPQFTTRPAPELAQPALKKTQPTVDRPAARISLARSAAAADLDGKLDAVADQVYGQPDFTSGEAAIPATNSSLNQPGDIAFYWSGQVFVADTENNRVLGWNCGYSYANGEHADFVLGQPDLETTTALNPPTAASMNRPTGVTVGFDGWLYVSDTGNNRVLVFAPTNYDEYWHDEEIYYDPFDYYCMDGWWSPSEFYAPIYFNSQEADYALGQPDFTSRTARPTNVDTLNSPMGLVTDVNDNLVVADHGNNRVLVYKWNEAGTIGPEANWLVGQEISGVGNEPFTFNAAPDPPTQRSMNGPTSVAADLLGDAIYVADTGNNRILYFASDPIDNVADGIIGQPDYTSNTANNGGLGASSLDGPMGLALDAGNRLYVADTGNNRVLVFDQLNPDGVADSVIGQPDFVSNTANNGGISAASLHAPRGMVVDDGYLDLYIADTGNNRALQYNQPLTNPVPDISVLDPGTVRAGAEGFTVDIWGTGIISDTVVEINGVARANRSRFLGLGQVRIEASEVVTTGQITVTLRNPTPGGGISAPVTLTIYAPTPGNDQADSVLGQRSFTTNWGPFAPVRPTTLFEPSGMVVDPATGRLFVADTGNARILSWPNSQAQRDGGAADLVIGKPDFTTYFYDAELGLNMGRPVGLALDSQGNLYVAEAQENAVLVYTRPFTNGMDAALIIHDLNNPLAVAVDSEDNLYVADTFNHRILVYETPLASQNTTLDRVFGQPDLNSTAPNRGGSISADGLHYPSGVAVDGVGNLYVSDSNNHRVLVYLAASGDTTADVVIGQGGDFTTGVANKGGISAESLNYPYGLLVDGDGNLYVADLDNNRVLGYAAPLATDTVADLVIGQSGSFARNGINQGRTTAQGATAPNQGTLRGPTMVGLNADGDLFVADNGNSRVLGFRESRILQIEWDLYLPSVTR
ncbi:MAG: NHL repeat-containing protein [Caldilineaceae bacterium]|nr:NHL repeat-containing protein [Caldilineaceae bacterium]